MAVAADEIHKRWGAAVRERRGVQTQQELAEAVGCDQRTISDIEVGRYGPSLPLRLAIAKALDTTHDTLFSVDEVVA